MSKVSIFIKEMDFCYGLNKGDIINIYFAQGSGEFYLIPHQNLPQSYDARKREWYIQTFKSKKYVSDQFQDILNKRNIMQYAMTVTKDNAVIGVIAIDRYVD